MDIIINFRRSSYRINRHGIKKISFMDWKKFGECFDALFAAQVLEVRDNTNALVTNLRKYGFYEKVPEADYAAVEEYFKRKVSDEGAWRSPYDNTLPIKNKLEK